MSRGRLSPHFILMEIETEEMEWDRIIKERFERVGGVDDNKIRKQF